MLAASGLYPRPGIPLRLRSVRRLTARRGLWFEACAEPHFSPVTEVLHGNSGLPVEQRHCVNEAVVREGFWRTHFVFGNFRFLQVTGGFENRCGYIVPVQG